jgi:hypothetical protein
MAFVKWFISGSALLIFVSAICSCYLGGHARKPYTPLAVAGQWISFIVYSVMTYLLWRNQTGV